MYRSRAMPQPDNDNSPTERIDRAIHSRFSDVLGLYWIGMLRGEGAGDVTLVSASPQPSLNEVLTKPEPTCMYK